MCIRSIALSLPHRSTIILENDDDEFLVLPNPNVTLASIAAAFRLHGLCMTQIAWRIFGDDGHVCQVCP